MAKFGDMFLGLLVGSAVGYAVAMLYAPRTGDQTREMLTSKSMEIRDRAMDTFQDTKDKTGKLIAQGRQKLTETVEQSKDAASDLADQGKDMLNEKRADLSESLHRVADTVDPTSVDTGNFMPPSPSI